MTTNLAVMTITAASNFYIAHSKPSPHHSGASTPATGARSPTPGASGSGQPPPIPPRPRALVFLTSDSTRKNLSKVHAVSGEAVKVSAKTVGYIDSMIRRAVGAKPKRDKTAFLRAGQNPPSPAPGSPTPLGSYEKSSLSPPPYATYSGSSKGPALPPRAVSPGIPGVPPPLPPRKMNNKERILISADLILSTIDDSTRKLLDASTGQVGKIVHHKYGEEAAESSTLMANTARNVGLVYIDMSGIGRRALLKRATKTFVKARFQSNDKEVHQAQAAPIVN